VPNSPIPGQNPGESLGSCGNGEPKPSRRFSARRASLLERAKELRALAPGLAAGFTVGDDASGLTLRFVFTPGDAIVFGYSGGDEERRLRPLIDRCARALDSEVVLF